jgi:hypothetical protein
MLIDGIGLSLIAVCTALEGTEDWEAHLHGYVNKNPDTILCWFAGLLVAVGGLILVIINAASLETLPHVEHLGMAMITFAPVINTVGWLALDSSEATHNISAMWLNTEFVEFCGMNILNLSYFTKDGTSIMILECSGYFVLSLAALLDISFVTDSFIPDILIRRDYVHVSDAFGLLLLAVVSVGKHSMESCNGTYRGCRFLCPFFGKKKVHTSTSADDFDIESVDKKG